MEKTIKIFQAEIRSVDHADHTVEVIVSTGSVDRHLEAVDPEAFKKRLKTYRAHPILLSSHDYGDLMKQIGEAKDVRIKDGALVAKFKYYVGEGNAEADWAFNLASKKVASYSIGFIPHAYENTELNYDEAVKAGKPLRTYTDVELIEISQVLIPSNRDAVQERSSLKDAPEGENKDIFGEIAGLCVKALEAKDLFPKVKTPDPIAPEIPAKDFAKEIDGIMAEIAGIKANFAEMQKAIDALKEIKIDEKSLAGSVLALIKSDAENEKKLKVLILEAVTDIVQEDFYRDLIFGKVGTKVHQPTQEKPESLSDVLKDIAKTTKL